MGIFVLVYSMLVSGTVWGTAGLEQMSRIDSEIKSGARPPIVVPLQAGIPWLTEKTSRDYQAWEKRRKI